MAERAPSGKVAVLMGGRSAEREISLRSGRRVLDALRAAGVDAHPFDPAERELDALRREGFGSAFIALHGRFGEDGTVQGALELLRIPYTGSGVLASAMAMDKVRTKQIWFALGLATPAWRLAGPDADPRDIVAALGLPLIVKPVHEGSTLGLTRVEQLEQFASARELAAGFDPVVLAEAFVDGPELTVAILGEGASAQALPVIEIRAPGGNYDYEHKYFSDQTRYLCPAPLAEAQTTAVQALALQAYRALDCAGWGRVDLMLDAAGVPWLLEVNTSPGMTDHSLVPMAAQAVGIDYQELVLRILEAAALKIDGGPA
ncbi:MAG: D-alanine--D-alanine ligase [Burkholderiales bacterium]|nr:MAG: D-alanine--D-alanine ligase [Burkholderiales bacterium]